MRHYYMMLTGPRELTEDPRTRIPAALCLNASGTMNGMAIRGLNAGERQCLGQVREELIPRCVERAAAPFRPVLVVMHRPAPGWEHGALEEAVRCVRRQGETGRLAVVTVGSGPGADMPDRGGFCRPPVRMSRHLAGPTAPAGSGGPVLNPEALRALAAEPWPEGRL